MRSTWELVWPRCSWPCFHWHRGWGPGGDGLWPLCGDLCSTPLHSHPDILGTHEHHFVHCNFNSLAYTSHDLSHLPPTFLPDSCNNTSFLLCNGNCKTVLWKHPCQWCLWALCGLCFSPEPSPYWHLLCLYTPGCFLSAIPRCLAKSPKHMWLPYCCPLCFLYPLTLLFPQPLIWTQHTPLYSHSCCQPLFGYPTITQPHHLWCEDQTNTGASAPCVIKK